MLPVHGTARYPPIASILGISLHQRFFRLLCTVAGLFEVGLRFERPNAEPAPKREDHHQKREAGPHDLAPADPSFLILSFSSSGLCPNGDREKIRTQETFRFTSGRHPADEARRPDSCSPGPLNP